MVEYLDIGQVQKGDSIILLTDDDSTIEEIQQYHANDYNWIYLDRPRNRGIDGGFDGHIPSGDHGYEMLAIETELRVATFCQKIVCGKSGFMESLVQRMDAENRNYTLHYLETRVSRQEATKFGKNKQGRANHLFQRIHESYQQKKKEQEQ